jgi:excinuclease ABC subunit C
MNYSSLAPEQSQHLASLLEKAKNLPDLPGCYLMRNKKNDILYVGKAKSLKKRVQSYFNESFKEAKTIFLVQNIDSFDFILTSSEREAFVLENNLIKKHFPRYNILLKDDKTYPYVQFNFQLEFPTIEFIRRPKKAKNFIQLGPYPTGYNLFEVIRVLRKYLKLRDCTQREFSSRKDPCLLYQLDQCHAPCVRFISPDDYLAKIKIAQGFFVSNKIASELIHEIENKMMDFADKEEFEKSILLRDYLKVLKEFNDKRSQQNVELINENKDFHIFGFYFGEKEVDLSVYQFNQGMLLASRSYYFLKSPLWLSEEEAKMDLVLNYYQQHEIEIPDFIGIDLNSDDKKDLLHKFGNLFSDNKLEKIVSSNKWEKLIEVAVKQAKQTQEMRQIQGKSIFVAQEELQRLLSLSSMPRSMECFDVAVWQGDSPTASSVFFYDGKPEKSRYRHYHLEKRLEGNNDFAMMKEVISRRLESGNFPDLWIIDGGKGQVNLVQKVMLDFNLKIEVIGITKVKDAKGNQVGDKLFLPKENVFKPLPKHKKLYSLIAQMRDEAHRFSRKLHHFQEKKRLIEGDSD